MLDHVHICISIPPKHSVSYVIGYIKGKSAISIARRFVGKTKNFTGENFWARGYFVTTIGLDEKMIRAYVRNQDKEDAHYDQLKLGMRVGAFRRFMFLPLLGANKDKPPALPG